MSTHAELGTEPVTERIALVVNGTERELEVDTRTSLLDLLREQLGLTGSKKGCDHGQCGACTVLLDGRRALSCLALAVAHGGAEIVTVEGLAEGSNGLHPMQRSFVEHDALQCGFCTPGQVMSAVALLHVNPKPTLEEARHAMSGNLCRCGAYDHYLKAVMTAAKEA